MEEDVEIEMLLKANEKLFEAAMQNERIKSKEFHSPSKHPLNSEETKSMQNKENITRNMICDQEGTFFQLSEHQKVSGIPTSPNNYESNENELHHQTSSHCKLISDSRSEKKSSSTVKGKFLGVDHQLNVHMLNAVTDKPYNYYSSHVRTEQTEEEEYSDDGLDDQFAYYKDDDFIDVRPEEPQLTSLNESQSFRNEASAQKPTSSRIDRLMYLKRLLVKKDKLLIDLEKQLLELLSRNKERQNTIQDALTQADKSKTKECGSSRCCFRKFGMPYFKDNKLFCAPPNKDHQQKIERDELMIESIPKINSWIKPHKEMMKNAIKKSLISEKSVKLTKEINKIKDMLEETANKKKSLRIRLQKKIVEKQNELKSLSEKSFNELVLNESDDREYDWMRFSATLFDGLHSPEECKRFWNIYLKPSINKEAWSKVEDSKLLEIAAQKNYQDWDEVAKLLGTNRSAYQCFVHFKARLEGVSNFSNGKWTDSEDKKLLTVINSSKIGNYIPWTKISSHLGNRNHNQIYSRWAHSLNPDLVKGRFSKEEDLLIVAGIEVFDVNFKELASLMNNRTSSQIRERYERHLLPKTAKVGIWSLEEDEKLLTLIEKYGAHNWSKISYEMKTRTRTQVRQRYSFIQKMRKKKPGWTVAQVKRRNIEFGKNSKRINKLVEKIKEDVDGIEKVFHLSDIEKETFLLEKLAELKDKIFSRKSVQRGRKRKEVSVGSDENDVILDLFSNCYSKSIIKPAKLLNDIGNVSIDFYSVQDPLGLKVDLPKSVEEIQDNPRLNFTSKRILISLLNSDPIEYSSKKVIERQICSGMAVCPGENSLRHRIDYPISEHDDTIIMRDWWHTPPINVASLNFSEFFKRTVFDYSNGMHKDIWNAKVKRSLLSSVGYRDSFNDQDTIEEGKYLKPQNYNLPPNQFTGLGLRSILLNRAILERLSEDEKLVHPISCDFVKKEVEDREESDNDFKMNTVFLKAIEQFEATLESLFTWPCVLSGNNVGSVIVHDGQNLQMTHQLELQKNLSDKSQTIFCSIEDSLKNQQNDSSRSETTIHQEKLSSKETLNPKHLKSNNVSPISKDKKKRSVKKRKLGSESQDTYPKKRRKREKSTPRKVKKSLNHEIANENNNLTVSNLSNCKRSQDQAKFVARVKKYAGKRSAKKEQSKNSSVDPNCTV